MADEAINVSEETKPVTEATTKPRRTSKKADTSDYWSVGRRKTAVARIKMALGNGDITVNDKPLEEYTTKSLHKARILSPLAITERQDAFNVSIKVAGGGSMAQLDAIALGIARALLQYDTTLRPQLKQADLLTRDPRAKERKKYGLKRARKSPQFSKR